MKTMKIKLTNDFHNSEVTLTIRQDGTVSYNQIKKARKSLCGCNDCLCSGDSGQRGQQEWVILSLDDKNYRAVKSNTF